MDTERRASAESSWNIIGVFAAPPKFQDLEADLLPECATLFSCSNGTPMKNTAAECAFCDDPDRMSREHIFSDWINKLLPIEWDSQYKGSDLKVIKRKAKSLDQKARVVCERCNNTWMNDIETEHSQPVMTPLILGQQVGIPIKQSDARSIAIFAFKTAVVLDHCRREREPFFSRRLRHAFRKNLSIPTTVSMWLCPYLCEHRRADYRVGYFNGELSPGYKIHLYVLTCGIGCFAFQVVAVKQIGTLGLYPLQGFERLAVPFWPGPHPNLIWPPNRGLRSLADFQAFHDRWNAVTPIIS